MRGGFSLHQILTPGGDGVHQALEDVDIVLLHIVQVVNEPEVRQSVSGLQDLVVSRVPSREVGSPSKARHPGNLEEMSILSQTERRSY